MMNAEWRMKWRSLSALTFPTITACMIRGTGFQPVRTTFLSLLFAASRLPARLQGRGARDWTQARTVVRTGSDDWMERVLKRFVLAAAIVAGRFRRSAMDPDAPP